ncbi:putative Atrial natriuretic peptide receptor 2 [Hypsibius exemplaris]|uniref:Atrial natriuretic peptide receptor 2 n=1 Tax=Hypsibius exemplaris TaxID=2072580 RepID=A0A1W0WR68_HYPEX|nr:putative Atrial natriuretic peptide receptor 2 [Hypsibius exemplaris]
MHRATLCPVVGIIFLSAGCFQVPVAAVQQSVDSVDIITTRARSFTTPPVVVQMGVVLSSVGTLPYDYYKMGPAIDMAVERALRDYNIRFNLILSIYDGDCSETGALGQTATAIVVNNASVILGPACTSDMIAVARLTTFYSVALITGAGNLLDASGMWPYVTRTGYNTFTQWTFFKSICDRFRWRTVFILSEEDPLNTFYKLSAEGLINFMRDAKMTPVSYPFKSKDGFSFRVAESMLDIAAVSARVIVLLMTVPKTRQFLVQAQRRGMCNGDYAFFAVDILKTDMLQGIGEGSYGWQTNDIYDQEASTAFRALFILSLRQTTKDRGFKAFEAQVRARVKTNNRAPPLEVNYYSRCFYDAVLVYAAAMQMVVDAGGNVTPDNAIAIGQLFNNNTYNLTSSSGMIFLDGNGDKLEDYQLLQMQPTNNSKTDPADTGFDVYEPFVVVAEYYGYRGNYEPLRPVRWLSADGRPVANRPECGFDGSDQKCIAEARRVLGAALGGAIAAIILAVFLGIAVNRFLIWRVEINNLDWVAAWVDIYIHQRSNSLRSINSGQHSVQLMNGEKATEMVVQAGILQFAQKRIRSAMSLEKSTRDSKGTRITNASMMKTSTIVATFRGAQVLVRPCMVDHVELTSGVRSEVRLIRTFVCENLVKFMAACIELEHVVVLGEYCSRGTLEASGRGGILGATFNYFYN